LERAPTPTLRRLTFSKSLFSGYSRALECLRQEKYDQIISACTEELSTTNGASSGDGHTSRATESLLLRGTFYILTKQMSQAFEDLGNVIDNEDASAKLRVNALIKRASLFIQQCKDPQKDPEMSLADFKKAEMLDSENTDIYHHRGQVHLLIEQVDAAIQDFDKAVKLNPTFPIAYVQKLYTDYRKASMEGNSEKVNNIINLFEQAVQKFPTCVESYALFAQVKRYFKLKLIA
jgi:import receptor subunit TOM70